MSEPLKGTNQFSNEEIIDDLTRDLKTMNTEEEVDSFVISPKSRAEDFPSCSGNAPAQPRISDSDHLPKYCAVGNNSNTCRTYSNLYYQHQSSTTTNTNIISSF